MIEVLFAASVAFVGYVIYVLVDEQINPPKPFVIEVKPLPTVKTSASTIKTETPKQVRSSVQATKTKSAVNTKTQDIPKLVSITSGSIWKYLQKNGSTSVAKMIQELPEDNKTLQRSIGWLAQEDKITLDNVGRVETIALKDITL